MLLHPDTKGVSRMNKPEKIFLNNANLMYALNDSRINSGTLRETFILNQIMDIYSITSSGKGDFVIDREYTLEVGGSGKSGKQLEGIENAFIAADNIEFASGSKIPLWLFGFLY